MGLGFRVVSGFTKRKLGIYGGLGVVAILGSLGDCRVDMECPD